MQFSSLDDYRRALAAGAIAPGDIVFVARAFCEALSDEDREWLRTSARQARVRLVTGMSLEPPIVVREGWTPREGDAAAPPPHPSDPWRSNP
ncbi:MAG: hypothetical protein ACJ8AO_01015 [Gemmatimonadaceae bacterium]